jgi:peptidyl-prolyl cis-trans isomerase SurA
VVDRVVAIVGGEIITLSDVKGFSAQRSFQAKLGSLETKDPLESLIREKLLAQEIDRLGLAVTDQEIDQAIQEVLSRNRMTLDQLKSEIAKKGTSFDKYKKDLSDQIFRMKFMGQVIFPRIKITEEEIARKMNGSSTDEARYRARLELLQERSPEELKKYLDEVQAKTYIEIKK